MKEICFVFKGLKVGVQYKYKGKDAPLYAMKAYRGGRGTVLLILHLDTRWRWMVNFIPRSLLPAEKGAGRAP
jgi:hypothetical protein